MDNTDPAAIREVESRLDFARTLFIVSSKSGTTTETLSLYRYFYARVSEYVVGQVGDHFVAITDPATPLWEEARHQGFRHCFENPEDMGGRYAPLSYFGLVPMALQGIDIAAILDHSYQMRVSCGSVIPAAANPGINLGTLLGMAARHGRDKVTLVFPEPIQAFGAWTEQLLAESTGKEGRGLVPVHGEALASPDGYSHDRVFVSMHLRGREAVTTATQLAALEAAGHPVVRISIPGSHRPWGRVLPLGAGDSHGGRHPRRQSFRRAGRSREQTTHPRLAERMATAGRRQPGAPSSGGRRCHRLW